jgi:N-acetylglucosaminyldiphosphoundecaprenol N-acetyl-beta-D-mannosaminyltransferase
VREIQIVHKKYKNGFLIFSKTSMIKTIECLGYQIFADNFSAILTFEKNKVIINTINAHSYIIAKKDQYFKTALMQSEVLLPDGVGITTASKLLNHQTIEQLTGPDLLMFFLKYCNEKHKKCFFLGSTIETLERIKTKLSLEYSNITIDNFSPPYKTQFSTEDSLKMIDAINSFNPDVLFVGMTAPKQEKWVYEFRERINAKYLCSVGAAFDFYCGNKKMPGSFWRKLGLIWLFRFLQEPKRLLYRNLVTQPAFLLEVIFRKIFK